ncbi:MAG: flagellar basal-body rod protein FlgF [Betaproteobacteria bacterium]|nr:flagellar basal-body rod protein FlgF [Betaproteobacteria bacterium]
MDRLIYIAMTGAQHALTRQDTVAQNLANANTTGYKAAVDGFRALPVFGQGAPTRAFVVDATEGADLKPGAIVNTGRNLDVAVNGEGWIAVQALDGSEAYTRDGSFKVSPNGILQTRDGLNVMGDGGPIAIPPNAKISIGQDGTVSAVLFNDQTNAVNVVGRIKLVNPPAATLVRGDDGLFRLANGQPAAADANVKLVSGALESSNVNMADALVNMISVSRQYDLEMKMLQTADSNAQAASQLLVVN